MNILENAVGERRLMSGNGAIARGAIEAGVHFSASYPGSPVVQVPELLAGVADEVGMHAEWSTNEIVALAACEAAALSGLRAICVMKHNGLNVALDFLLTMTLGGVKGGLLLVVGDDPSAHSSIAEQDTRALVQLANVPLLEPATTQEAMDMARFAFDLSEEIQQIVVLRVVTRLAHAQGVVRLGEIEREDRKAELPQKLLLTYPPMLGHASVYRKLSQAGELLKQSPYNVYDGPEDAPWLIVTSGPTWKYCLEAVERLGLEQDTGILKLGVQWPMPEEFIVEHLKHCESVFFAEELDPFIERNVMAIAADHATDGVGPVKFFGKKSGHVAGPAGPAVLEMNPDLVLNALASARGVTVEAKHGEFRSAMAEAAKPHVPERMHTLCAGCPHRASFWSMHCALMAYNNRKGGYVAADIGCYTLGMLPVGFSVAQCCFCMGSGIGVANGFGNLSKFGVDDPVLAVIGDSTFLHAGIPGLINAKYNEADLTLVVLDNSTTAMTGFQPHPGIGINATGHEAPKVEIVSLCRGLGINVVEKDPYNVEATTEAIYDMLERGGLNVLVLKHICNLLETRTRPESVRCVHVDPDRCVGEECGCGRFCVRGFGCPGIFWDNETGTARIDEVVCTGCGVCADLCIHGAIVVEEAAEVAT